MAALAILPVRIVLTVPTPSVSARTGHPDGELTGAQTQDGELIGGGESEGQLEGDIAQ
jgi:hypothetical protein